MAIIGLVAGAAAFVGRQDSQSARMAELQAGALAAADYAHATVIGGIASEARSLSVGQSVVRELAMDDPTIKAGIRFVRLSETVFALVAEGRADGHDGLSARRRASQIVRFDVAELSFPATIALEGDVPDSANALIDGADREPVGWACPDGSSDAPPVAVVRLAAPSDTAGCSGGQCSGPDSLPPPPGGGVSAARELAAIATLRSRASLRLPPGTALDGVGPAAANGECSVGAPDNWGDPSRSGPCGDYLPLIHAEGNLTIGGGAGQGILIVDGDLTLSGGFQFTGAVVVRGTLIVEGAGATIVGGVRSGSLRSNVGAPFQASFARSSCAVRLVLLSAAPLVAVAERAWALSR
jgi:hypothetical protein